MKKILIRSAIVLLILVIVAVVAVGYFLGDIVKKGVETYGPQLAKVSVTVDNVGVSLLGGSGSVKGLEVGNPEGYRSPEAITVGRASAAIKPFSVFSDKVVVRSVRVESPVIHFEGGINENNLTKILENLNESSGGTGTNTPAEAGKKLQVDDLHITDLIVNVHLTTLGERSFKVTIPEIHLTQLGQGPEGITSADLSRRVLDVVLQNVTTEVAKAATQLGKEAMGVATDSASKALTGGVERATKGLGDLFKKK